MTCGDGAAAWIGSGSVWSGVFAPGTEDEKSFTAMFLPELLGSRLAATVIALESGAGTWVLDNTFRWSATAAGIWHYDFEATAVTCDGTGKVTYAEGGVTDDHSVVHSFNMTRTA